jgi:hypothetical protein
MNIIYANGDIQYGYLNGYFELFLEDLYEDEDQVLWRDLTQEEFIQLVAHIEQHELFDSILADIEKWENYEEPEHEDEDDDYDPSVMSDDLETICIEWFRKNITLETA